MRESIVVSSDFLQREAKARQRTLAALALFALTLALVAAVSALLVVGVLLGWRLLVALDHVSWTWYLRRALAALAVLLGVVAFGAWRQLSILRVGGEGIAKRLGSKTVLRPGAAAVQPRNDPREKQLLDVVEEMSLAAGISVPGVCVLEKESGINAFAMGLTPADACVVVTRGAMETLKRDELQGMVAHEISHILNADTRLNLRVLAWVGGIATIIRLGGRLLKGNHDHSFCDVSPGVVGFVLFTFGVLGAGVAGGLCFAANSGEVPRGFLPALPAFIGLLTAGIVWRGSLIVRFITACGAFFSRLFITWLIFSFGLSLFLSLFYVGRRTWLFSDLMMSAAMVALVSLPLIYPIGLFGRLCGRLFQAAICRQREFLADASALQFTRNPDCLVSLLTRIKHCPDAGALDSSDSLELGHMLFVDGSPGRLFSTHPSPARRIEAIQEACRSEIPSKKA